VKVAPDLDRAGLGAVLEAVDATGVEGIVATNTTLSRDGLTDPRRSEAGGLSGDPLRGQSTEVVRWLVRETGGRLPVIGVGGIAHPDHALEKLDAGAALVQVYTGLVYAGPALPGRIARALLARRSRALRDDR
jgi:dihydroorotate dehydrogenase